MTHNAPAVYLVWSILVGTLFVFLIHHLWAFDRFRCLKWNSTGGNGTFKRVMTYSYLTSIPLLLVYAIGFCYIKYIEGYVDIPGLGIIPKPTEFWAKGHRDFIFPLQLCFALAWSLEIVSHLEELCFWLFLIHTSDASPWFRSPHFIFWAVGSCIALAGLPSVTIYLKDEVELCEAWTFLTGSIGSLVLTILFLPVLIMFPRFLRKVRSEGVDPSVMVRLTKFQSLNITRVVCRFVFVVPLLVTAIDGVRQNHVILTKSFATDFLAMLGGFGCVISSMITILIFFPRSYEQEAGYRYRERPMTELWSDENEKSQLAGGNDEYYTQNQSQPAYVNDVASRMDRDQDRDPYAYWPRPHSRSSESKSTLDGDSPAYQDRNAFMASSDPLITRPPVPVLPKMNDRRYSAQMDSAIDPRDHPYITPNPAALRSPPPPRPEKNLARRSRAPVWEMVTIEQDDADLEQYYSSSNAVSVKRNPSSNAGGGLTRNVSTKSKSNLHPILQNYSSPINVYDVQRGGNGIETEQIV